MNTRTRIGIGVLLVVVIVLLVGVFSLVQAQSTANVQQWEYAVMAWSVSDNNYAFNVSVLYDDEGSDFQRVSERDVIDQAFETLNASGTAGLVDFLAVLGLQGYELVAISSLSGGGNTAYVYHFKRPEAN